MGLKPMLAESVPMERDKNTKRFKLPDFAEADDWMAQLKADGQRYLIDIQDGVIGVLGRNGQPKVTNISHAILGEFEVFKTGHWTFDGELVNNQLLLFDLPVAASLIGEKSTFEDRYQALQLLLKEWHPDPRRVVILPCAQTLTEKENLISDAQNARREGVMLRHRSGLYLPSRRSRDLLKCKFESEIDAIVTGLHEEEKDNCVLSLLDPETNKVVRVGKASIIGKDPVPQLLDVWIVRFLYVLDPVEPKLYQPRLIRRRSYWGRETDPTTGVEIGEEKSIGDKALHECLFDQLLDKFTDKDLNLTKTRADM